MRQNKTHVTLYAAISADGFIAGSHDETPWSNDAWAAFTDFLNTCDVVLLGRRTYEIMTAEDEFVDGPEYIVATRDSQLDTGNLRKIAISSGEDIPKVNKVGVIGGGDFNGSLAKQSLLDEVILDIEPIILGDGKRLFGSYDGQINLELISSRKLGTGTVQNHYRIRK